MSQIALEQFCHFYFQAQRRRIVQLYSSESRFNLQRSLYLKKRSFTFLEVVNIHAIQISLELFK